jgi:hypothetical protein
LISRDLAILGLFLGVLVLGQAPPVPAQESPCEPARAQWAQAHESLKEAANALRETQVESIEPRIDEALKDGKRITIAQKVQIELKDRNRRISEAAHKCVDAADQEKAAFEQLRRCSAADSARRSASHTAFGAIARERSKLLADLQDLLLDEAYIQYKRESPNPPTYSGYGPDQQSAQYRQPGAGRGYGYDAYAPGYGYGYQ